MARELGVGCVAAIANKITESSQIDFIKSQIKDIVWLESLRYSRAVQEADLKCAPVIGADAEFTDQLRKAKGALADLVFSSKAELNKR
jgi:CO dehydrogenase nickel-insertion accessory protein CooC1